jgi:hypothetical protein
MYNVKFIHYYIINAYARFGPIIGIFVRKYKITKIGENKYSLRYKIHAKNKGDKKRRKKM